MGIGEMIICYLLKIRNKMIFILYDKFNSKNAFYFAMNKTLAITVIRKLVWFFASSLPFYAEVKPREL